MRSPTLLVPSSFLLVLALVVFVLLTVSSAQDDELNQVYDNPYGGMPGFGAGGDYEDEDPYGYYDDIGGVGNVNAGAGLEESLDDSTPVVVDDENAEDGSDNTYQVPTWDDVDDVDPQAWAFLEPFQNKPEQHSQKQQPVPGWIIPNKLLNEENLHSKIALGTGPKSSLGKNDRALIFLEKATLYEISKSFPTPLTVQDTLVVQYEIKPQKLVTCSGSYLKLPIAPFSEQNQLEWNNEVPYSIMFGPDKCGETNRVHLIVQTKNPITGKYQEHHLKDAPDSPFTYAGEPKWYLLTMIIEATLGTYKILIDTKVVKEGRLKADFDPPFQPVKEIDDPNDFKPKDWVDDQKIPDPNAVKPDDWDETQPKQILDPNAEKPQGWLDDEPLTILDLENTQPPADWDEEEDGEWVAPTTPNPKCQEAPGCGLWSPPMIPNPKYKGKWVPLQVDNPQYKGPWIPRKIDNPDYYDIGASVPILPIGGVGIDIWAMDRGLMFDNILITTDPVLAQVYAEKTWAQKALIEQARQEEARKEALRKAEKEAARNVNAKSDQSLFGAPVDKTIYFQAAVVNILRQLEEKLRPVRKMIEPSSVGLLIKQADQFTQDKGMLFVTSLFALSLVVLSILLGAAISSKAAPRQVPGGSDSGNTTTAVVDSCPTESTEDKSKAAPGPIPPHEAEKETVEKKIKRRATKKAD